MKIMRKLVTVLFFTSILFGCSKSNDPNQDAPNPEITEGIEVEYEGYIENSETSRGGFEVEGTFKINSSGAFVLEDMVGSMIGTAVLENNAEYKISINEAKGSLQYISSVSGTYGLDSKELLLVGKDVNNNTVTFEAKGITIEDHNQQWQDSKLMSTVFFTHNSTCEATISIDYKHLGPINAHYHEGGFCDSSYDLWMATTQDVDEKYSKVFCATGTLEGLNGSPVEFEDCYAARFVLGKNTEYSYEVDWGNGTTSSGTFTSPDGGGRKSICLVNNGPICICNRGNGIGIIDNSLTIDGVQKNYDACDAGVGINLIIGAWDSGEIIYIEGPFWDGQIEDFTYELTYEVYILEELPHIGIPEDPVDTRFTYGLTQGYFKVTGFSANDDGSVNSMTITFYNVVCSNYSQTIIRTINGSLTLGWE